MFYLHFTGMCFPLVFLSGVATLLPTKFGQVSSFEVCSGGAVTDVAREGWNHFACLIAVYKLIEEYLDNSCES